MMKKIFIFLATLLFNFNLFSNEVKHNPWDIIFYRPDNYGDMNEVRCYLKIEDEEKNNVTDSVIRKASYEWIALPGQGNFYQNKNYYLSGGMAMHLNINPGKYFFYFYTPVEKQNLIKTENTGEWKSNIFEYNTENPVKVLFVYPTADDNGFYNGGWILDFKAPKFFKWTKSKMLN